MNLAMKLSGVLVINLFLPRCFATEVPLTNYSCPAWEDGGNDTIHPMYERLDAKFAIYSINDTSPQIIPWNESIAGKFSENDEVLFIVHGLSETIDRPWVGDFVPIALKKISSKVVIVDWREGAQSNLLSYPFAMTYVPVAACVVSRMILKLQKEGGINPGNIRLFGHSLGAQVVGYAAQFLKKYGNFLVGRITASDPTAVLYGYPIGQSYLSKDTTSLLEVVHTTSAQGFNLFKGNVGIKEAIGHIDYYVNGGSAIQPGCNFWSEWLDLCSHIRAHAVYREVLDRCSSPSESHDLPKAMLCKNLEEARNGDCLTSGSERTLCPHVFGDHQNYSGEPLIYYIQTKKDSPYLL